MPLKDNTLFIHVPRSGGTSITNAMGIDLKKTSKEHLYCPKKGLQHFTAKQICNTGVEWKNAFSVVRDPVERLTSEWFYGYHKYIKMGQGRNLSPEQCFLDNCIVNKNQKGHFSHFASYKYLFDGIENIRLLSYYNLQKDWSKMIKEWQLPWDEELPKLNHAKSRGRIKLSYSVKQDIAEIYKEDYKLFKQNGIEWIK
jgi:hypothetical protein